MTDLVTSELCTSTLAQVTMFDLAFRVVGECHNSCMVVATTVNDEFVISSVGNHLQESWESSFCCRERGIALTNVALF